MKSLIFGLLGLISVAAGINASADTKIFRTASDRYTVVLNDGSAQTARLAAAIGLKEITGNGDFTSIRCLSSNYCEFSFKVKSEADYNKMSSPFSDEDDRTFPMVSLVRIERSQKVISAQTDLSKLSNSTSGKIYRALFRTDEEIPDFSKPYDRNNAAEMSGYGIYQYWLPGERWSGESLAGSVALYCHQNRELPGSNNNPLGYGCTINVIVDTK